MDSENLPRIRKLSLCKGKNSKIKKSHYIALVNFITETRGVGSGRVGKMEGDLSEISSSGKPAKISQQTNA